MLDILFLASLKRFSSAGVLVLRVVTGAFLLWAMWDIATSGARLRSFAGYLATFHFPVPYLLARVSCYAQLIIGAAFITGLFTRWAGILCAVNFGVALAMIDRFAGVRGAFPAACLTAIGMFLALHGSGRFGIDALLESRAGQRFDRHYRP
jgi:putative oxidoreductase